MVLHAPCMHSVNGWWLQNVSYLLKKILKRYIYCIILLVWIYVEVYTKISVRLQELLAQFRTPPTTCPNQPPHHQPPISTQHHPSPLPPTMISKCGSHYIDCTIGASCSSYPTIFSHWFIFHPPTGPWIPLETGCASKAGPRGDWLQMQYSAYCIYFGNTYFGSVLTN